MEHEKDFSWNVNKSISNKDDNEVTPIVSEHAKDPIKTTSSNIDTKAEMEELFEEFKQRVADIIHRETNKK